MDEWFKDWFDADDSHLYDAIFNNERHAEAEIAAAILAFIRQSWPDRSYFMT